MHEDYVAAAIEDNGVGNANRAKNYAGLALRSSMICRGHDNLDDGYRGMEALRADPWNLHPGCFG